MTPMDSQPPPPATVPAPHLSGVPGGEVRPRPGDRVALRMSKWDGSPHWATDFTYLGRDEAGHWLGGAVGERLWRPGADFGSAIAWVRCVPDLEGWIATIDQPPHLVHHYVDIATPPLWQPTADGWLVSSVDLDLDVVRDRRLREGHDDVVWVDDRDEFAEHQRRFNYPAPLIARAEHDCDTVEQRVRDRVHPFGDRGDRWLADWVAAAGQPWNPATPEGQP